MRALVAHLLLATAVCCAVGQAYAEAPLASTLRDEVLVRRIQWPVRIDERRPGACDALAPRHIVVREDGVVRRVDGVSSYGADGSRPVTTHVLLLDTSGSMRDRLDQAKRAARSYIEALRDDDPVLLGSFSDTVQFHGPPTTDRALSLRAIESIGAGSYTAFDDAVYYTMQLLAPLPGRKVILALTDGCDSASLEHHPFSEVLELAAQADNVSIFPIGLDLPSSCEAFSVSSGMLHGPGLMLRKLADHSGGRLFNIRNTGDLRSVYDDVRAHLEREGSISYRPLAFGDGEVDRRKGEGPVRRRVRIRSEGLPGCKVASAGPLYRLESAPGEATASLASLSREQAVGGAPHPVDRPLAPGRRVEEWVRLEPETISLQLEDVVRERGALYHPGPLRRNDRYRLLVDYAAKIETRRVDFHVPSLDALKQLPAGPTGLLLELRARGWEPFDRGQAGRLSPRDGPPLSPRWLHGLTFLEIRGTLAQSLLHYPGYREWVGRRLREDRVAEALDAIDDYARREGLDAAARQALEAAVLDGPFEPDPSTFHRYLAAWLGDIPAHALVVSLERDLINAELLRRRPPSPATLALIDDWSDWAKWFPAPTRVRTLTPALPAYEAERDLVGFYRILLPTATDEGRPFDLVPEDALAWRFLRSRMNGSDAAARRLAEFEVESVNYLPLGRRHVRRLKKIAEGLGAEQVDAWSDLRAVRIRLGDRSRPETGSLTINAFFRRHGDDGRRPSELEPFCVSYPRDAGAPEALDAALPGLRWSLVNGLPDCGYDPLLPRRVRRAFREVPQPVEPGDAACAPDS